MIPSDASAFRLVPEDEWLASNAVGFAIADRYPVAPGHTLVVPRRPIETWWESTSEERIGLWALVDVVKRRLDAEHQPDGYNVGFNAGAAAGQTVAHLHIHVIPRHAGDVPDPRGGVRHVIPSRGNYLLPPQPDLPPLVDGQELTLSTELLRSLRSELFDRIDLVVSFIMKSGLAMIARSLEDAIERGARTRVLTTDYLEITDADALARLLDLATRSASVSRCGCSATPRRAFIRRPTCSGPRTGRRLGRSSAVAISVRPGSQAGWSGASVLTRWRRSSRGSSACGTTRAATVDARLAPGVPTAVATRAASATRG